MWGDIPDCRCWPDHEDGNGLDDDEYGARGLERDDGGVNVDGNGDEDNVIIGERRISPNLW